MLKHLYVKNLGLIEEATIELSKGLNVLTGETGAGKSMLLGSLGILMGYRASKDLIGAYGDGLYVEGFFSLSPEEEKNLQSLEIESEDKELILSVTLSEKGKVCRCNGKSIPASLLKDISKSLITIHGQHESQILLNEKTHLQLVDIFGQEEIKTILQAYQQSYKNRKKLQKEIKDRQEIYSQYNREKDLLLFEIKEIEQGIFTEGEDEILESEYQRMHLGKTVVASMEQGYRLLGTAEGFLSKSLQEISSTKHLDESCMNIYQQLLELEDVFQNALVDIEKTAADFAFSENELADLENKLNQINRLKGKYGQDRETILKQQSAKMEILERIESFDEEMAALQERLLREEENLQTQGRHLSLARKKWAKLLEEKMSEALLDLHFPKAAFEIRMEEKDSFDEMGINQCVFYIGTNEGQPLRPIKEIASGGELSRIMLCLKSILAAREGSSSIVFDEIDTGISGVTAEKVAKKLRGISRHTQVICITHLAQIAAGADNHLLVEKISEKGRSQTRIYGLDMSASTKELARILGGSIMNEEMLVMAQKMKESYQQLDRI